MKFIELTKFDNEIYRIIIIIIIIIVIITITIIIIIIIIIIISINISISISLTYMTAITYVCYVPTTAPPKATVTFGRVPIVIVLVDYCSVTVIFKAAKDLRTRYKVITVE